jgi:hypothetical protein
MKQLLGRKFLAPIMFALLVILNRKANLGLGQTDLWMIVSGLAAFILGESYVDAAGASNGKTGPPTTTVP